MHGLFKMRVRHLRGLRSVSTLLVVLVALCGISVHADDSAAGSELLYEFQGFALVLDEGFAPIVVDFEKVEGVCGLRVVSAESILRSLSGSDLYPKLVEVLGDARYVIVEAVCGRSVGEGISVFRDGSRCVISIPAGPCLIWGVSPLLRVTVRFSPIWSPLLRLCLDSAPPLIHWAVTGLGRGKRRKRCFSAAPAGLTQVLLEEHCCVDQERVEALGVEGYRMPYVWDHVEFERFA